MRYLDILQRHARPAGLCLCLVLGLAAAYAVSGLFMGADTPSASLQTRDIRRRAVAEDPAAVILQRNVMNLAVPAPDSAAPEELGPPPDDPLSWACIGILANQDPAKTVAFILTGSGTQIMRLGEVLMGWTLAEVLPKSTIWTKGDERRELMLSKNAKLPPRRRAAPAKAQQEARQYKKSIFSTRTTMEKALAAEIIKNPVTLLEQALYKPYKENDEVIGFKITNIKPESVLNNLGIQDEDVLMSLNGESIKDPASLLQAYAGLEDAESIAVDVLRNGQVESILVNLQ